MKSIKLTISTDNFMIITPKLIKKCIGAGCRSMRDVQEVLSANKIMNGGEK